MASNPSLMAVESNDPMRKRKRKSKSKSKRKRTTINREDRLSSLHDDILIEILSRLPLRLAMATDCLSWRWRGLWTNVTSTHIDVNKFDYSRDVDTTFNKIITRITSPFIHSFSVELGDVQRMPWYINYPKRNLDYSWLRRICDRNVRQLKLSNTSNYITEQKKSSSIIREAGRCIYSDFCLQCKLTLPSFICVTQSLVSIELDTTIKLLLPDDEDEINLPNLKKLHLCSDTMKFESLEKLIKVCPSLEELGFVYKVCFGPYYSHGRGRRRSTTRLCYIKFSHQNLQRLLIKNLPNKYRVVINAPKLEYLSIRASKSVAFRFEEEPMKFCEAKIDLSDCNYYYKCGLTEDDIKSMAKFYGLFRNITILTPDVFVLKNSWPSNMFCNATQLTLSIKASCNINILSAILELCPVLDALTLQICDTDSMERAAEMPCQVSTWQRVLKKIKIEIKCDITSKTTKSFAELVEYLLSKSVDLKQFHVTVDSSNYERRGIKVAKIREMELCQLLYQCPAFSADCEVEFVGRFFNMSRKAGLKIWITNAKDDIPIN